jgi:antitoxin PrlF
VGFTAKITSKGQMTLPSKLRKALGVQPGDRVDLTLSKNGEVKMRKISRSFDALRGIVRIDGAAANLDRWIEEARADMATRGMR